MKEGSFWSSCGLILHSYVLSGLACSPLGIEGLSCDLRTILFVHQYINGVYHQWEYINGCMIMLWCVCQSGASCRVCFPVFGVLGSLCLLDYTDNKMYKKCYVYIVNWKASRPSNEIIFEIQQTMHSTVPTGVPLLKLFLYLTAHLSFFLICIVKQLRINFI